MNQRQHQLVQYLKKQSLPTTAQTLALELGVSVRTIKSDIKAINIEFNNSINGTNQGFLLNKDINLNSSHMTPETPKERVDYIIQKLIIETVSIDIDLLAEELFVSESSIRNDLTQVKRILIDYDLFLHHHQNLISIEGLEKNKRRLMGQLLYQEMAHQSMNQDIIVELFPYLNLEKLEKELLDIFSELHYFINDFALMNVLSHLAIIIDRTMNHQLIESSQSLLASEQEEAYELVKRIASYIENEYHIELNKDELNNLFVLLISNVTFVNHQELLLSQLDQYIDLTTQEFVQKIIASVHSIYYIDLNDREFIIQFSLHLNNLLSRAKNNKQIKNPMANIIKTSYPLIYDIAVYIASLISDSYQLIIQDDEISFIALHLGGCFERKQLLERKLKCMIIAPQYYSYTTQLVDNIKKKYTDEMVIIDLVASMQQIHHVSEIDLIITTQQDTYPSISTVQISPFLQERDHYLIRNAIYLIQKQKHLEDIKDHVTHLFEESLFFKNPLVNSRDDVIHFLAQQLYSLNYVKADFEEKVWKREDASSTAFDKIAIPHAIDMDALQTKIAICILDKPLIWDQQGVHIVLLLAINKHDRSSFKKIFQILTDLFNDPKNIKTFIEADSYHSFINTFMNLLQS